MNNIQSIRGPQPVRMSPRFGVRLSLPRPGDILGQVKDVFQRNQLPEGFTRTELKDAPARKLVEDKILATFDQLELVQPRTEKDIVQNPSQAFTYDVGSTYQDTYMQSGYYYNYEEPYQRFVTGKVTYALKPKPDATTNIASVKYTIECKGKSSGFLSKDKDHYLKHFQEELVVTTRNNEVFYYNSPSISNTGVAPFAFERLNKQLNDKIRALKEQGKLYLQNKDQIELDTLLNRLDQHIQV